MYVHDAILYISLPSLQPCDMKLPDFTPSLHGVGEHNTKVVFFYFLNLDPVLSDSTRENFASSCQINWNWMTHRGSRCILEDPGAVSLAGRKGASKFSSTGGRAPGYLVKHNSRRVRTHEKNSRDAVRRLGTIIKSIFCAQPWASIRLTVWKRSGETLYPGALPSVLEIPNIPQLPVNVLINELMKTPYHYINLQFMNIFWLALTFAANYQRSSLIVLCLNFSS